MLKLSRYYRRRFLLWSMVPAVLLTAAQDFARLLQEHKLPFIYAQAPGEHTWEYWNREVGQAIAVQYNFLRRGRTPDKLERE